jgi:polysaccharide biosynthesis transport protein
MATETPTMPRWGHVAAARQALRERRGKVAGFGDILWRRKLLVLACVGVVLALTAAYVSTLTPAYQAEALVALGDRAGERVGQGTPIADQLRLIESRAMAERLVDRLDLHFLPEFRPDVASRGFRLADLLPNAILNRLPKAWTDSLVPPPSDGEVTDEQRAARLWEQVIGATMGRIRAEVTPPSVIVLKFISEDPELAAAGANGLADLYLEQRLALEQNVAQSDRRTREQEIERLRASIRETAEAIEAARSGASAQASATSEQKRLDLTGELAFWRRERAEVEARRRQMQATLESGVGLDQAALFVNSERLGQLQARASELQQALAALAQQDGEQDPQVLELRAQLAALEQERRAELELVVEQIQDELAIIQSRETALAAEIEALEEPSAQGQAAGGLVVLEQRLEAERAALREYLEQAAGRLGGQPSAAAPPDARVIAPAVVPSQPTYPRLTLIWAVASAGALLFGTLLAFTLEAFRAPA